jgi:aldose 1-epimerase
MIMNIAPLERSEIELRRGSLIVRVRPDVGGSLSGFWYVAGKRALPILRPAMPGARDPVEMASFPLVPFCNRVKNGRFTWQGRDVYLPPNHPGDQFVLHGYGWKVPWQISERDLSDVQLLWQHEAGIWPWRFDATQDISVTENSMRIEMRVVNRSDEPMPCGLGHHPYFPLTPQTILDTSVREMIQTDTSLIPTQRTDVAEGNIFGSPRHPHGHPLDNTFTGWTQPASIEQPHVDLKARISAEPHSSHLAVFVPPQGQFFCVEPVTNVPNALNMSQAEGGITKLEPGESLRYLLSIEVVPLH